MRHSEQSRRRREAVFACQGVLLVRREAGDLFVTTIEQAAAAQHDVALQPDSRITIIR
ncbi:MAG TPA: hypothetical protein VG222_07565 [Vicinamibacterales bacterium]|nr:hypothetical protein [Vicinamibacterales bacterium]